MESISYWKSTLAKSGNLPTPNVLEKKTSKTFSLCSPCFLLKRFVLSSSKYDTKSLWANNKVLDRDFYIAPGYKNVLNLGYEILIRWRSCRAWLINNKKSFSEGDFIAGTCKIVHRRGAPVKRCFYFEERILGGTLHSVCAHSWWVTGLKDKIERSKKKLCSKERKA